MAWSYISRPAPALTLTNRGAVTWNAVMQETLGDPSWVHLTWDDGNGWLGIYGNRHCAGFPVHREPGSSTYSIDSARILNAQGISVDENLTESPPALWENDGSFSPHERPAIYYLTLP